MASSNPLYHCKELIEIFFFAHKIKLWFILLIKVIFISPITSKHCVKKKKKKKKKKRPQRYCGL